MTRFVFLTVFILSAGNLFGAGSTYQIIRDHPYLETDDAHREAKCRMDIYYPENQREFATVVFVHAGGLRQGERYIPGELMNQGPGSSR